jgi:hypothetical protein
MCASQAASEMLIGNANVPETPETPVRSALTAAVQVAATPGSTHPHRSQEPANLFAQMRSLRFQLVGAQQNLRGGCAG